MRFKKTEVCQTCSKIKNVCQTCLLDLEYGELLQLGFFYDLKIKCFSVMNEAQHELCFLFCVRIAHPGQRHRACN